MPVQRKPIIHGNDHLPGHADPIPGLLISPSFPAAVGSLAATRDLRGYWRLGETASPFADTSGHPYGPADAVRAAGGAALTPDQPGALPAGDDDGAVEFNGANTTAGDYLDAPDPPGPGSARRFNFNGTDAAMTVLAWVKPDANAGTFPGGIVSVWADDGNGYCGWSLAVDYPARTPRFTRRAVGALPKARGDVTGASLPTGSWTFIAASYDLTGGHSLYVNGALVDSDPTLFVTIPAWNFGPNFATVESYFYPGLIDEVSLWGDTLTLDEIATLYEAGLGGTAGGAGVTSLAKSGASLLVGDVTLSEGANVMLTQAGQDIAIAAAAGGAPTGPAGGALDGTYPNPGIAASVAGAGLAETSDVLSVNVDGSTVEIASDALRVKTDGITATQIAADAVGSSEIAAGAVGSSELASTTVTAGSYGDATHVGQFTVDADGRLTAASNVTVSAFSPATATSWWVPLFDTPDGTAVLDTDHNVILTLVPIG